VLLLPLSSRRKKEGKAIENPAFLPVFGEFTNPTFFLVFVKSNSLPLQDISISQHLLIHENRETRRVLSTARGKRVFPDRRKCDISSLLVSQ
jgi:hypothetical protein